jgi:lipoyl(octanoyl) transferase
VKIVDWGTIDYLMASERQLSLVEEVANGLADDTLVLCSHPPVVTVGRGTKPSDIFAWQGQTIETSRGGRATYHGPSQLVIYPILNLTNSRKHIPAKDVHAYLRALENATVEFLNLCGVKNAKAKTVTVPDSAEDAEGPLSLTGVWVNEKKIASIGIAVRKWTTYHGVAVNIHQDANAFRGINPCGFKSEIMTSVEEILDATISKDFVLKNATASYCNLLSAT